MDRARFEEYYEPPPYGWCENCEEETEWGWQDCSFGYEYGSIRGVHHDWQLVCSQCHNPIEGG